VFTKKCEFTNQIREKYIYKWSHFEWVIEFSFRISAEIPTLLAKAGTGQPQATATARISTYSNRYAKFDLRIKSEVSGYDKHKLSNLLWTTAVVEPQEPYVAQALNGILALTTHLSYQSGKQINMAMQVGTQLYQQS